MLASHKIISAAFLWGKLQTNLNQKKYGTIIKKRKWTRKKI